MVSSPVAIKKGYCRLCWLQARFQGGTLGQADVWEQDLRQVQCHGRITGPGEEGRLLGP